MLIWAASHSLGNHHLFPADAQGKGSKKEEMGMDSESEVTEKVLACQCNLEEKIIG